MKVQRIGKSKLGLIFLLAIVTFLASLQLMVFADNPTGTSYILYEEHGYTWVDAEKRRYDDGGGIGPDPGEDDDWLCWTATASNVLEWTGWGLVGGMWDTDAIFDEHKIYFNDTGSWMDASWHWWLNGYEPGPPLKLVSGGGNKWPSETWTDYYHNEEDDADVMSAIDQWLRAGYGVGIGIFNGGHAITVWGFNYNESVDPSSKDYYLGIWVADSDSDKNNPPYWSPPPIPSGREYIDRLSYYEVEWNSTANWWYMPNYGGGWMISRVQALEPYPSGRPEADAGGPYVVNEGTTVNFDASGSDDPEDDTIYYRWDIDYIGDWDSNLRNYTVWDTSWSSSTVKSHTWNDDYSGDVILQIRAEQLLDIDATTVTVNNVAPAITVSGDTIDENGVATVTGTITDPGIEDTFSLTIDWGEGSPEIYSYAAGTTSFSLTHQYLDDDPTGTPFDFYTVSVTVTDDDGGSDTESTTVTVNNVAPAITVSGDTIDENGFATVTGTITDPGIEDTFSLTIDWGEGPPETFVYPAGSTTFSETHQYLDDDPTGTSSDDYTITVNITDDDSEQDSGSTIVTTRNVDPVVVSVTLDQPNPQFVLPLVHTLNFTGTFTDIGTMDVHTAVWDWGDTTTSPGTVDESGGSGTVTGEHVFSAPGTYTVNLTVTDDDTGVHFNTTEVVVVTFEEAKHITVDYIKSLPDEAFKGKADQRKSALENMFSAIDDMWDSGEIWGIIKDMNNNIRSKCDGTVDGKPNDDWIIEPEAQYHICMKIDDMTAYLMTFL